MVGYSSIYNCWIQGGLTQKSTLNSLVRAPAGGIIQPSERICNASKLQQWAFNELKRQVTYKANAEGRTVETVIPAYTSQRCAEADCGCTHKDNRDGAVFVCQNCEVERHSDYNAARHVAHKYSQNRRKSGSGEAIYHLALPSGTMTGHGDYSPSTASGSTRSSPTNRGVHTEAGDS